MFLWTGLSTGGLEVITQGVHLQRLNLTLVFSFIGILNDFTHFTNTWPWRVFVNVLKDMVSNLHAVKS